MRHSSRSSWASRAIGIGAAACLVMGSAGCESVQRKFTRKPKHAARPLDPIIKFQDYTRAMTPLDKYQKHYMMFDYWNDELISALQNRTPNPKRFRRASTEALSELQTLYGLTTGSVAERFAPMVEERTRINQRLQHPGFMPSQANALVRALERQTRDIQRDFFWRDVEDSIQQPPAAAPVTEDAPTP